MTRNEAIAAGLATYRTGRPCKNGHDAPRYSSCGVCVECSKQSRTDATRLHNTMRAVRTADTALFAYKLHPDDHAAALAFCQALDLQRGRTPAPEAVASAGRAPVGAPYDPTTAAEIARRRAEMFAEPTPAPYVPQEFAKL